MIRNTETFVSGINRALAGILERYPEAILLGEDVEDPYGGAFKASAKLSVRFPGRVINMPVSEPAIIGVGSGLALSGMRPIVEIMFGDFVGLAADQIINHAAKFPWMYGREVPLPLTIRTAAGSGRNYGPTHSQSLETMFIGLPDFEIWAPFPLHGMPQVYETAFLCPRPTLIVESKALYPVRLPESLHLATRLAANGETLLFSNCLGAAPDVLVLAYGRMAYETLGLLDRLFEDEVLVELAVPARVYPFAPDALAERLAAAGRVMVIEEGWEAKGWGRYLAGLIHDRWFDLLDRPVRCLGAADLPIGTAPEIEAEALPTPDNIYRAIREFCR